MTDRRNFIKNSTIAAAGITMLGSAKLYAGKGANEKVNVALIGLGVRSKALVRAIHAVPNAKLVFVSDVDDKQIEKFSNHCKEFDIPVPKVEKDFRKVLESKDVDAIVIATADHWHAPMSIMGLQAGKHVYVEKPCSHNAAETEMLVNAQKKYNKVVQMGNQQRSSKTSSLAVKEISEGIIGNVYAAKAFYNNARKSIGKGNVVEVPSGLDWDLWQGPAPREDFRDNIQPYNWHWFRSWGTGEIHNNATHELDVCRWALGVDYPKRVVSVGGRLHFPGDDWEWFDTQMASYEFEDGKTITWEGRSCNAYKPDGGRGAVIYGTEGTIRLDRKKYVLFDLKGNQIKEASENGSGTSNDPTDTTAFGGLTIKHMHNFINTIRNTEKQNSPIADSSISTQLCHLGNIAQDLKTSLDIDTATGRIVGNDDASKLWGRSYEKGWEPTI